MAAPTTETRDEFYCGYLPAPPGLRRFALACGAGIVALLASIAALAAAAQHGPLAGRWDAAAIETFEGTILTFPYPMLLPDEGPAFLLVEETKFGAQDRVEGLDGQRTRVRGSVVERDGYRMIALSAAAEIEPLGNGTTATPRLMWGQPVSLRGEIVDPKCWLGAMRPGYGKPHMACAALCIAGGIPPVLVVEGPGGAARPYLLVGIDGGPLHHDAHLLANIGRPVEVAGSERAVHGWPLLFVSSSNIDPR